LVRGKYIADYWCEDEELLKETMPEDFKKDPELNDSNSLGGVWPAYDHKKKYHPPPPPVPGTYAGTDTVAAVEKFYNFNDPSVYPYPVAERRTPIYKYSEDKSIAEFAKYIEGTYSEHYSGNDKIQAFDVWEALDTDPTPSHRNTALKYLYRYGKKAGHNRKDLLKTMHYILMLLHYHNKYHQG
jgi:hypothetical protein